jgi:hypothetical protein
VPTELPDAHHPALQIVHSLDTCGIAGNDTRVQIPSTELHFDRLLGVRLQVKLVVDKLFQLVGSHHLSQKLMFFVFADHASVKSSAGGRGE